MTAKLPDRTVFVDVTADVDPPSNPDDRDAGIPGRYGVVIAPEADWSHRGEIALDVFHARIGIAELDDFTITARTPDGTEAPRIESWENGNGEDLGDFLGRLD